MSEQDEFLKRILSAFKIEAEEIIETMTSSLLELEKEISEERRQEVQELIYRQAHTLKGAARAVEITEVESICQLQESVFSLLKSGKVKLTTEGIDTLHKSIETISKVLASKNEGNNSAKYDINGMIIKLQKLLVAMKQEPEGIKRQEMPALQQAKLPGTEENEQFETITKRIEQAHPDEEEESRSTENETIRVSTAKLDKIFIQLEELLSVKLSIVMMTDQLRKMILNFKSWEAGAKDLYPSVSVLRKSLKKDSEKARQNAEEHALQKTLRFLQWGNTLAKKTETELTKLLKNWDGESAEICLQIDTLLNDVKKIMTVPFAEILELSQQKECRQ